MSTSALPTERHSPDAALALDMLAAEYRSVDQKNIRSYPDRHIVAIFTETMLDILFPEYRVGWHTEHPDIPEFIAHTSERMAALLTEQSRVALQHMPASQSPNVLSPQHAPNDIIRTLFQEITSIRSKVLQDVEAAYEGDPAAQGIGEIIASYPSYTAVTTYRIAHALHQLGLPIIPRMMTEHAHQKTGIDIHPGSKIGTSFFIDHGTGVVIGETTNIGDRVKLYQGVTLGAYNFAKDEQGALIRGQKRHPTIEDDVTVYANATILGGDTVVGARSVIGSNVWLSKSVAPDSLVTMEEPTLKIKTKRG